MTRAASAPGESDGPHDSTLDLGSAFADHRRFLWGLCYRMTGSAADADDVVQSTYLRAMERPPVDTCAPWRPWLTSVALNLSRDLLRQRRRRRYVGPWLPGPIETPDDEISAIEATLSDGTTTEGRYDLLESVSYAFLIALEALTPKQRAVLLLRDVFDYSVLETAGALGVSSPDVKTTHHRARRAMAAYDRERCRSTRELRERTRVALATLFAAFATGDAPAAERLLAGSVRALSDGGGEYHAARVPLVGRERVLLFFTNIARRRSQGARSELRTINGMPAVVTHFSGGLRGDPPRMVTRIELDASGQIREIHSILASRKLAAIGPLADAPVAP